MADDEQTQKLPPPTLGGEEEEEEGEEEEEEEDHEEDHDELDAIGSEPAVAAELAKHPDDVVGNSVARSAAIAAEQITAEPSSQDVEECSGHDESAGEGGEPKRCPPDRTVTTTTTGKSAKAFSEVIDERTVGCYPVDQNEEQSAGYPEPGEQSAGYPEPGEQSDGNPDPSEQSAGYPDPGEQSAGYPDPSERSAEYPDPSEQSAGYPDPSEKSAGYPDPSERSAGYPDPSEPSAGYPDPSEQSAGYPGDDSAGYPYPGKQSVGYADPAEQSAGYPDPAQPRAGYPDPAEQSDGYPAEHSEEEPSMRSAGYSADQSEEEQSKQSGLCSDDTSEGDRSKPRFGFCREAAEVIAAVATQSASDGYAAEHGTEFSSCDLDDDDRAGDEGAADPSGQGSSLVHHKDPGAFKHKRRRRRFEMRRFREERAAHKDGHVTRPAPQAEELQTPTGAGEKPPCHSSGSSSDTTEDRSAEDEQHEAGSDGDSREVLVTSGQGNEQEVESSFTEEQESSPAKKKTEDYSAEEEQREAGPDEDTRELLVIFGQDHEQETKPSFPAEQESSSPAKKKTESDKDIDSDAAEIESLMSPAHARDPEEEAEGTDTDVANSGSEGETAGRETPQPGRGCEVSLSAGELAEEEDTCAEEQTRRDPASVVVKRRHTERYRDREAKADDDSTGTGELGDDDTEDPDKQNRGQVVCRTANAAAGSGQQGDAVHIRASEHIAV